MYRVDIYLKVRQACLLEGKSQRQVSREFGLNRRTVSKMVENSLPPGYRRQGEIKRPKLEAHKSFIDGILEFDKKSPRKQRHTIQRLFDRLKEERGYEGGYTILRDYVSKKRQRFGREVFVPLTHEAGSCQVDFGEASAIIGNTQCELHLFVMDLPQSDGCFVKAYYRETMEAFLDGHVSGFEFFGGVPGSILYDNTRLAVSKIVGQGTRQKTQSFSELESHYLFKAHFARVGKGNDKGNVENLVGYARRTFMVPLPRFETLEALNEYLASCCLKRQEKRVRGHKEIISKRLEADKRAFRDLPLPSLMSRARPVVVASVLNPWFGIKITIIRFLVSLLIGMCLSKGSWRRL